jgi:hypothetical protein
MRNAGSNAGRGRRTAELKAKLGIERGMRESAIRGERELAAGRASGREMGSPARERRVGRSSRYESRVSGDRSARVVNAASSTFESVAAYAAGSSRIDSFPDPHGSGYVSQRRTLTGPRDSASRFPDPHGSGYVSQRRTLTGPRDSASRCLSNNQQPTTNNERPSHP